MPVRTNRHLAFASLATIVVVGLGGCQSEDAPEPVEETVSLETDELPLSPEEVAMVEEQVMNAVPLHSALEVDTPIGTQIAFFHDPGDGGVLMVERGVRELGSLLHLPELEGATALEVFRAVSPPDAQAPDFLLQNAELTAEQASVVRPHSIDVLTADGGLEAPDPCSSNACSIWGWDWWHCAYDIWPKVTKYWVEYTNTIETGVPLNMRATACHSGGCGTYVYLYYRFAGICGGDHGSYYLAGGAEGFPWISSGEYAVYSFSAPNPSDRRWYLYKPSAGCGYTDLTFRGTHDCP